MGLIIDDDDVGAEVVEEIVVVDTIDVTAILLSVEGFVMLVVDGVAFAAKNDQYICDEDDVDDKNDYDLKYDDDDDDDDDDDKYDDDLSMMMMMILSMMRMTKITITIQMLMMKINMMMSIMINMTVLKTITMIL